jgi:methyl-accepting chemotaxis protein
MKGYKRKTLNLAVKSYFQRWLLVRIAGLTILCSLIAALVLYFYARTEITGSFFEAHVKIRRVSDLLLPVVIAGSVVSLVSGIILSLFLPQKIAGPIYRIEKDLLPIQEGDLTSLIQLREGDVLKDLVVELNKTTNEIRTKVQNSKAALAELAEALVALPENSQIQDRIQDLQHALAQLKTG